MLCSVVLVPLPLQEAVLSDTTKYLQTQEYPFSSWQCKYPISTGHDARSQAPPALLLLDLARGWLRAWHHARELCWHSLKRCPFARNRVKDSQDFSLSYVGPCQQPFVPVRAETQTLWVWFFFSSESSCKIQAQSLPAAFCPAPTETAGGGAAGVCRSWGGGAHHLSGVHTRAASVAAACVCASLPVIQVLGVGNVCTEANGAMLV